MAVIGPSELGRSQEMLTGKIFLPKFVSILFLYRETLPIKAETAQIITNIFQKNTHLDFGYNIENGLLIFDHSCEEVFTDKGL